MSGMFKSAAKFIVTDCIDPYAICLLSLTILLRSHPTSILLLSFLGFQLRLSSSIPFYLYAGMDKPTRGEGGGWW